MRHSFHLVKVFLRPLAYRPGSIYTPISHNIAESFTVGYFSNKLEDCFLVSPLKLQPVGVLSGQDTPLVQLKYHGYSWPELLSTHAIFIDQIGHFKTKGEIKNAEMSAH